MVTSRRDRIGSFEYKSQGLFWGAGSEGGEGDFFRNSFLKTEIGQTDW